MKSKEFKSGTLSIRFTEEERKLVEISSEITNHSCSSFLKMILFEGLKENEQVIKKDINHRKRISNLLKGA